VNNATVTTFMKGDVFSLGLSMLYAASLKNIKGKIFKYNSILKG